MSVYKND